jgi:hypothetical protein
MVRRVERYGLVIDAVKVVEVIVVMAAVASTDSVAMTWEL